MKNVSHSLPDKAVYSPDLCQCHWNVGSEIRLNQQYDKNGILFLFAMSINSPNALELIFDDCLCID